MNILDVFKDTLQDDMEITKCKEFSNKYKLTLSYKGMSASCEINKLCMPGNEKSLCMQAIDNAISTMYLSKGDLKEAEAWLHGERWNKEVIISNQIKEIEDYLETSYSGAKMMDDVDAMCRIARALVALKADPETEIFTDEFQKQYVMM